MIYQVSTTSKKMSQFKHVNSMKNKNIKWIIAILIVGITAFFIGRSVSNKETIKYIEGPTITDSIPYPVPYEVKVPSEPEYIYKRDTLWQDSLIFVHETIDTLAILADWIKQRNYENVLFDVDTLGRLVVNTQVQYNKLQDLRYTFTPVQKQVTKMKDPLFEPFIFLGANVTYWRPELEVGTFIKSHYGIGFEVGYVEKPTYSFKIGYKF